MSEDNEEYGPRTQVWNHLYSGLDYARMDLGDLELESRRGVESLGAKIHAARRQFVLARDQETWAQVFEVLLRDPWYRFAAEIEFGYECVGRAEGALDRFVELKPILTEYQLGPRASAYLREAIDTYLFGFDAASIALSGGFVEQVLRDVVVARGIYSEARLRRERPSGTALLENAKRDRAIVTSYDAAKRVLDHRNEVMHKHIWDTKIIGGIARRSIEDLGLVLCEAEKIGGPNGG